MRLSPGISTPSNLGISVVLDLDWFHGDFENPDRKSKIQIVSALPLFVAGILADDAYNVLPLHDLARFAKSLYRCSYFHCII